jgi:hypothetical protein
MKKRKSCCATAIEATGRLSWCRKKCEEGFETGESAAKARFAGFSKMRSWGCAPSFSAQVRFGEPGAPVLFYLGSAMTRTLPALVPVGNLYPVG